MTAPVATPPSKRKKVPHIREASPLQKPYQPIGHAVELMYAKDDEVILDGPAGTGKSRAVLEKIHLCCQKYPRTRALLVRKTRESLTQSAMVTFEQFVVPDNGMVKWRSGEGEYRYTNGSKIIVGGMDKASKIMSTEYDIIFIQEVTELTEDEYESLTTRARFANMPYNQLIADCNPGPANHWVKRRWETSKAHRIKTEHTDNPKLWDYINKKWTPEGEKYIRKLKNLTGVRRKRLYEGLWVSAEGMIYDMWDPYIHLIDQRPIPDDWRKFISIDFGFTNPFVCQWWALDEDARMYLYREIYRTKRTVKEHAEEILRLSEGENIDTAVCDHDAEDRATLEENGISTIPADKRVKVGIEAVQERLKVQEDGKPRLFIMRDSLLESDLDLEDAKLPIRTVDEVDGYSWSRKTNKDEPIKRDDHGMDDMRYAAMHADTYSASGGIYI